MQGYRRPSDEAAVAHNFRVFAAADCIGEPLYATLSRAIADDDEVVALTMRAPYSQRRPVLLFAAVHDLLLDEAAPHALARFYPSVVADDCRDDVEQAMPLFVDFCREHREALVERLAGRATQTNEVGRSAGLRLALSTLPRERPIALVDIGCSAGLNLLVDRYRYDLERPDGSRDRSGPIGDVVVRSTIIRGDPPRLADLPLPAIGQRIGIDRAPLDVRDPSDARWLRACVWPSDLERHPRLAAAIAMARCEPLSPIAGDAVDRIDEGLASIDRSLRPVFFHSWVVSYFDHAARARFADAARAMVVERDGAWISAESPGIVPGLTAPPLPGDADVAEREATVWHLTTRRGGRAVGRCIARSHPHGRWIEWFGQDAARA